MATLNGGISASADLIRVSGTLPAPGTYFTIDSEAFLANGAARGADGRSFTRDWLAVDRGVAGTTKATHSNGATLTVYYPDAKATGGGAISATDGTTTVNPASEIHFPDGTLVDLGGGVAGVLQIRLIGPFTVAYDTPGIEVDRVAFGPALTDAEVILGMYVSAIIPWNNATTADLTVGAVWPDTTGTDLWTLPVLDPVSTVYPSAQYAQAIFLEPGVAGDRFLAAFLGRTGSAPTAGSVAIYALIGTLS